MVHGPPSFLLAVVGLPLAQNSYHTIPYLPTYDTTMTKRDRKEDPVDDVTSPLEHKEKVQHQEEEEEEEDEDEEEEEEDDIGTDNDSMPSPVQCWDEGVLVTDALLRDAHTLWDAYGGDQRVAKSVWIDADGPARCVIEATALQIADFHLAGADYQGVEIWTQFRKGAQKADDSVESPTQQQSQGLEFHFDKDEQLVTRENVWKHPVVATATYLTTGGAPLVVFATTSAEGGGSDNDLDNNHLEKMVQEKEAAPAHSAVKKSKTNRDDRNNITSINDDVGDESSKTESPDCAWICYPQKGRHVAFAGNFLHGVVDELLFTRPADRLSLLANVWLDHKPVGIEPLSNEVLKKMHASAEGLCVLTNLSERKQAMEPKEILPEEPLVTLTEHIQGDTAPLPKEAVKSLVEKEIIPPLIIVPYHDISSSTSMDMARSSKEEVGHKSNAARMLTLRYTTALFLSLMLGIACLPTIQADFDPYQLNGGLVAAVAGRDFVILAADTRLTNGMQILHRQHTASRLWSMLPSQSSDAIQKELREHARTVEARIEKELDEYKEEKIDLPSVRGEESSVVWVGSVGCNTDCEELKRNCQALLRRFLNTGEMISGHAPLPSSLAMYLGQTLYGRRTFPYYAFCVLAGCDSQGGHVFGYDAIGSYERQAVAVSGQGREILQSILDRSFHIGVIESDKDWSSDKDRVSTHVIQTPTQVSESADESIRIILQGFRAVAKREATVGDLVTLLCWKYSKDGESIKQSVTFATLPEN